MAQRKSPTCSGAYELSTGMPRARAVTSNWESMGTPGETTTRSILSGSVAGSVPVSSRASGMAWRIAAAPGGSARVSLNVARTPRAAKWRAQEAPVTPMPSTSTVGSACGRRDSTFLPIASRATITESSDWKARREPGSR